MLCDSAFYVGTSILPAFCLPCFVSAQGRSTVTAIHTTIHGLWWDVTFVIFVRGRKISTTKLVQISTGGLQFTDYKLGCLYNPSPSSCVFTSYQKKWI